MDGDGKMARIVGSENSSIVEIERIETERELTVKWQVDRSIVKEAGKEVKSESFLWCKMDWKIGIEINEDEDQLCVNIYLSSQNR